MLERGRIVKNFICFLFFWPSLGISVCLDLVKGPIIIEVSECTPANPQVGSSDYRSFPEWVHSLDANLKNKVLSGHQGILINGKVTDSRITPVNQSELIRNIKGQKIKVFIHSDQGLNCADAARKLIHGILQESCCDTGSQAPCLWDTSYFMRSPRPIAKPTLAQKPEAASQRTTTSPITSKNSEKLVEQHQKPTLSLAHNFYLARKFQEASKLLFVDWPENANNPQWIWILTQSLRQQDLCIKAIKPLEKMNDFYDKGELSLQHEDKIADSIFLLARCYAKTGKREEAVSVLQGMLYQKQLFKKHLAQSRHHHDLANLQALPSFQNFLKKLSKGS